VKLTYEGHQRNDVKPGKKQGLRYLK
jgi:hypothetical protein